MSAEWIGEVARVLVDALTGHRKKRNELVHEWSETLIERTTGQRMGVTRNRDYLCLVLSGRAEAYLDPEEAVELGSALIGEALDARQFAKDLVNDKILEVVSKYGLPWHDVAKMIEDGVIPVEGLRSEYGDAAWSYVPEKGGEDGE